jgi:hypothetical protein
MWVENFKRVKAFISLFVSLFGHDGHEQTNDFGPVVAGIDQSISNNARESPD